MLRERVLSAIEEDGWVADSLYHHMLGDLVSDRAETIVWLDLPVPLVMWRLLRRTYLRKRDHVVLWNGNVEPGWADALRYLFWPALVRAFQNRREHPKRFGERKVHRLRSDAEVRAFLQSIQATATMSGSSIASARQKTPPLAET